VALDVQANLLESRRHAEVLEFSREKISTAKRVLGSHHETTLELQKHNAMALFLLDDVVDPSKTWEEEKMEAFQMIDELYRTFQEHLGATHPATMRCAGLRRACRRILEVRGLLA
jgi:hypothetical protein